MRSLRNVAVLLLLLLISCRTTADSRYVRHQTLVSKELPAIEIEVSPPFRYEGRFPFRIGDIAAGERLVFVDADGKKVRRLFVAQFESFLPESQEIYRYDFTNAMTLGGHRFRQNVGRYSTAALRAERPGNEAALMHDFLTARGYEVEDELMMSRFVTLGAGDRRSELILFYIENARGGVSEGLKERSLEAFRIVK